MSQSPSLYRPTDVLPLFGGSDRVPSPVLVRAAVGQRAGESAERVRAAEGVASAVGELVMDAAEDPRRPPWETPVRAPESELMRRTGLLHSEVIQGLALLSAAGAAIVDDGDRVRLDPGILGALPCLARIDWDGARNAIARSAASIAPALAVLREIGRRVEIDAQGGSTWVEGSLHGLADSVHYGRTAVSQALSVLESTGLLARASNRRLRVRLTPAAFGQAASERTSPSGPAPSSGMAVAPPSGAVFGTHPIHLPPGTPIELHPTPDGGSQLRMGPLVVETAADGSQVLLYGALRIRP